MKPRELAPVAMLRRASLIGLLLAVASALSAGAQTPTPAEPFAPPVHRAPASVSANHQARVDFQSLNDELAAESTTEAQDKSNDQALQWQPAKPEQRSRGRSVHSSNAVYQKPNAGQRTPIRGQLISETQDPPLGESRDKPLEDPYGDRLPNLRTQHDEGGQFEGVSLRDNRSGRRAFAASLQQRGDVVDPYEQASLAAPAQDELLPPRDQAPTTDKSCDDFRAELFGKPIQNVDVNISATRAPSAAMAAVPREARTWSDSYGRALGTGTLVDVHHGYVVIESRGAQQRIPIAQLGEADLGALATAWRLPSECTLGDFSPVVRCWIPQTVTWKASNLCHKPLYFEDEQLERYGHSAGPVLQPLKSTAHFFVRVITWPYATGIHPMNECQYALGFYRPGNCAPWLIDPVPISLSGAARQALFVTGGAYILP